MRDWRFYAYRVHGDGTESLVATDVPLVGATVQTALTGPGQISGSVPVEMARLLGPDGRPLLVEHATALYAEHQGRIVAGGLLGRDSVLAEGPTLSVTAAGFTSHLEGRPYYGDNSWVQVDPAWLIRHAWEHAQMRDRANLGVVVDDLTTPVRIGEPERDVEFETSEGEEVAFTAGPVVWADWQTHDLGSEVDRLCQDTPIEYLEGHSWDGEQVAHRLILGYPRLGRRREDLRLVVGENVAVEPSVGRGEWASVVIVYGAGEGRKMRRGSAALTRHDRVHTPVVVVDKSLQTNRECDARAAAELAARTGGDDVTRLMVMDHPSAPLWQLVPGDEVYVQGSGQGWGGGLGAWVRVQSVSYDCDAGTAELSVTTVGGGA